MRDEAPDQFLALSIVDGRIDEIDPGIQDCVEQITRVRVRKGVALRKYETLYRTLLSLLTKNLHGNAVRVLNVPRGRFKAPVNPIVRNLIRQFIDNLEPQKFAAVTAAVIDAATTARTTAIADPEKYIANVTTVLQDTAAREIVHPLLAVLEKPLQGSAYSAIESVFEIETELVGVLTDETARQIPEALNTFALKGDDTPLKAVLAEFFDENRARQHLKDFFEGFAPATPGRKSAICRDSL
jgi:hypothetical protein